MNTFFKKLALGALLMLGISTGAAVATPIYNYDVSGTFADPFHTTQPGGTFSGTFSVTGTLNPSNIFTNYTLTAADFHVTSFTDVFTFSNLDYTLANSSLSGSGAFNYLRFDMGGNQFQISFLNPGISSLTGASIALANSYDHQPAGGNRAFLSGSVTLAKAAPVPEPSSLALLGAGLALLAGAFAVRRARKPASAMA